MADRLKRRPDAGVPASRGTRGQTSEPVGETLGVGIVGASVDRGFAMSAHIPALQRLPAFEIAAVSTTRRESAASVAEQIGAKLAFTDPVSLARHPNVDVVAVTMRVPNHLEAVLAAIDAGKHVYCEWPLALDTDQARLMLRAARAAGIRHVVGLQSRVSPPVMYARDLLAGGEIGRLLAVTVVVQVPMREVSRETALLVDESQGMHALTITGGHTLDLLRYLIGDLRQISAFAVNQYPCAVLADTGDVVQKTTLDQLLLSGIAGDDVAVAFQVRGGGWPRHPRFSLTVHAEDGDLLLTSLPTTAESMQRQALRLALARHGGDCNELEIPGNYSLVPEDMPAGAPFNVGQLYMTLAHAIREARDTRVGFEIGVACHELLDAVVESARSGMRQQLPSR